MRRGTERATRFDRGGARRAENKFERARDASDETAGRPLERAVLLSIACSRQLSLDSLAELPHLRLARTPRCQLAGVRDSSPAAEDGAWEMGVLFSSLYALFFSSRKFKVVIVGLDNAGKTTILYKLWVKEVV